MRDKVDGRLWIHNAVIGLAHPSPPWPQPLHDAGYRLIRIEQPVGVSNGNVKVDLVFIADARNALLAVECKDGTVQHEQADVYSAMTALDLVVTASITVPDPPQASVDVAYAISTRDADATVRSLSPRQIGVLVIGNQIEWRGARPRDPALAAVFAHPVSADLRGVPRLLPADDASPASAIAAEVANALHAAIEQRRDSITVAALVEQACWGWPRYGRAFRGSLIRKVRDMLREGAKNELEGLIEIERAGRQNDATIRLVAPPSDAATQAGELRSARAVRLRLDSFVARATGRPVAAIPGQLEIEGIENLDELDEDEEG